MLTEERQSHFARIIVDGIYNDDLADFTDDDLALKLAKRAIAKFVSDFAEIDSKARATVSNLKRNVPEGSPEWDILYAKYFEEEMRRKGN